MAGQLNRLAAGLLQAYVTKTYFGTGRNVESLKTYYEKQSSGRYSVAGTVSDWVKVTYNQARYGQQRLRQHRLQQRVGPRPGSSNAWVDDQLAKGQPNHRSQPTSRRTTSGTATTSTVRRLQRARRVHRPLPDVHAGGDEANGDPIYGEDAIWSHRWYAFANDVGRTGPDDNQFGGTQVGNSGVWVGDYTMQSENGGLRRSRTSTATTSACRTTTTPPAATAASSGGPMAQSRVDASPATIHRARAADLGSWDKLQLGWLDTSALQPVTRPRWSSGRTSTTRALPQAVAVVLPNKEVTSELAEPSRARRVVVGCR